MRLFLGIIILLSSKFGGAQLYGVQWVIGDRVSVLDFRNDTLKNYPIGPVMPLVLTSANICDSIGNLLYYTNGIYIAGSDGNQLVNGDSINPCDYTYQSICCGLNIPQAALFLPKPGDASRYYLLHFSNDTANGNLPGTLYYTQIRDSGLGVVEQKNVPFGKGIFRQGGMTACKHANGRDWWVVMGLNNSNEYFKYLVTPNGIFGPDTQSIGPIYSLPLDLPYCKFAQDGSKYAVSCAEGLILIMDFDRCSGEFSNAVTIFNESCSQASPCSGAAAVEFSPNHRFLYVSTRLSLNQYDLLGADPQQDSVLLYAADSTDQAQMDLLQLAPNNKIYGCTWNGGFYLLHEIDFPNLGGDSCHYLDTGFITLTVNSDVLPNMINYQLGALNNSGCDTIMSINNATPYNLNIRVYPNPAKQLINLAYHAQTSGQVEFELIDQLGKVVMDERLGTGQTFGQYSTDNLNSGLYYWKLKDSVRTIKTDKIVIIQ